MGRFALFAAVLFAAAVRAQSMDELYAAARQEGALAFYAGGPTAPWEAFSKDFTARYPGIKVSITGGFSNVLDRQVDAQLAAADFEVAEQRAEDGFKRLIDTVRRTGGDERNRVREHLVELFDLFDPADERVMKARRDLASALY